MTFSSVPSSKLLDSVDEFNNSVAVSLAQFAEFLHRPTGIATRASMPHNRLQHVAGAAIMHTVLMTRANESQTTSPQRSCTAPTSADVVRHHQAMLHHIGVRPNLLVRIARQTSVGILEEPVWIGEIVVARSP